jgi:hypothetical protein
MVRIHDTATDEVIDREMNDTEFVAYEKSVAEIKIIEKAATDKAAAQTALLAKLGITADEFATLL